MNIEPIGKLRNQLLHRPTATVGAVFSTSGFTDAAIMLTQFFIPQTIRLWNKGQIEDAFVSKQMRQSLVAKYRLCVEYGVTNFVSR